MENEPLNVTEENTTPTEDEKSDIEVIAGFEHLDISRVGVDEPEIYSLDFIEELCNDAWEFRTIEEHNLCSNFTVKNIQIENQFSLNLYANLILGLIVGFIAIRGFLDPWRN